MIRALGLLVGLAGGLWLAAWFNCAKTPIGQPPPEIQELLKPPPNPTGVGIYLYHFYGGIGQGFPLTTLRTYHDGFGRQFTQWNDRAMIVDGITAAAIALLGAMAGSLVLPAVFRAARYVLVPVTFQLRCTQCGYDLRATPDRCPECGTVPPNARSKS